MKILIPNVSALLLLALPALAQLPPDTLWTKTYVYGWESIGYCAQQTDDGGFILTGSTVPYGSFNGDVYLVKTDPDGNEIWFNTYGGGGPDMGEEVKQTNDGGYIIIGRTSSFSIDTKFYLIRTDSNGDPLWTRTYGSEGYDYIGTSVAQTSDGGFIITGNCNNEVSQCRIVLLRYNVNGDLLWDQIYRNFDAKGSSVLQLEDGCFIVAGQIDLGDADVFLMKTDENGRILWMQTYGGPQTDYGSCVRQTYDGGFIIAGSYKYTNWNTDFYLIKTDSAGDTLWSRTYGGDNDDYGESVDQTWDGGYIMTGMTGSFSPGSRDVYVIRTDCNGDTIWTDTYGGDLYDWGHSVQQTSDGGYIVAGYTDTPGGYYNAWLIRLGSEVGVRSVNPKQAYEFQLIPAHPNPFNPTTVISFELPVASWAKLEVFDISGRFVGARHTVPLLDGWRDAGFHEVTFDGSNLASGIYIYHLQADKFTACRKMVLMK